jgi:prevent-host-death family protein
MERYVTASEARQRFLQLIEEAREGDQVIVTKHGAPSVVLIDFEQLTTLKRLASLWQDPEALRAMHEAHADIKAKRVLRVKTVPTVRKLLKAARARGLIRG